LCKLCVENKCVLPSIEGVTRQFEDPKAKFVYGKDDWDVGGRIYNDYIKCCKGRIGLQTMTDVDRERHMEKIWMRALNKKIQKKSLVQKRSAIYTVMQNKFIGK
jgi:hypothetical protein